MQSELTLPARLTLRAVPVCISSSPISAGRWRVRRRRPAPEKVRSRRPEHRAPVQPVARAQMPCITAPIGRDPQAGRRYASCRRPADSRLDHRALRDSARRLCARRRTGLCSAAHRQGCRAGSRMRSDRTGMKTASPGGVLGRSRSAPHPECVRVLPLYAAVQRQRQVPHRAAISRFRATSPETGSPMFVGEERNTLRLPVYGRLDLRANRTFGWAPPPPDAFRGSHQRAQPGQRPVQPAPDQHHHSAGDTVVRLAGAGHPLGGGADRVLTEGCARSESRPAVSERSESNGRARWRSSVFSRRLG